MSHFLLLLLSMLAVLIFWGYVYLIYRAARHLLHKYGLQDDPRWWLVAVIAGLFLLCSAAVALDVLVFGQDFIESTTDGLDTFYDILLAWAIVVGLFVIAATKS